MTDPIETLLAWADANSESAGDDEMIARARAALTAERKAREEALGLLSNYEEADDDTPVWKARRILATADALAAPYKKRAAPSPRDVWLVWSMKHGAWWGPDRCGYYSTILEAGIYTYEEAKRIESQSGRTSEARMLPKNLGMPGAGRVLGYLTDSRRREVLEEVEHLLRRLQAITAERRKEEKNAENAAGAEWTAAVEEGFGAAAIAVRAMALGAQPATYFEADT